IIITLLITIGLSSVAQKKGYKIKIKFGNIKDSLCFLANYYGDKQYIKDTIKLSSKGEGEFAGNEELPKGIYLVVTSDKKYFEILIDKEQNFSIETDSSNFVKNMIIKGSADNKQFYEYLKFIADKQKEQEKLSKIYKRIKDDKEKKDSVKILQKAFGELDKIVTEYKNNIISKEPDKLLTKIFLASKEIEVPEAPLLPNGKKDSTFGYRYYKKHYFDNIDFTDDRLLRTPLFHPKLEEYFEKLVYPAIDSIIKECDYLIEKARPNKEMYKYLVWHFTRTYETSNIMGYDAIFVYLAKKYYISNEAFWTTKSTVEAMEKRVKTLEPLLIGKKAPNLIMLDTIMQPRALWDVNAKFTLILFWDPECGHCKTELPKLLKFYNSKKQELGIEVFAVCTDTNVVVWKKHIKTNKLTWINVNGPRSYTKNFHDLYDVNSTPVIYVLNDKKEIIAKRIGDDQLEGFINNYRKKGNNNKL
ncbi:MAG: DUF5106 domain-containing protein, partial [Bacteroidales bacterium]|nr:DUF5106 domain-containing protein [Bacteroidales bacterium]